MQGTIPFFPNGKAHPRTPMRMAIPAFILIFVVSGYSGYLDPNSFSSLGTFNPASDVTVNMSTGQMSGGVSATGVVSGGILVFTFDTFTLSAGRTISFTNVPSSGNKIAFLSKGEMTIGGSILANGWNRWPGPGGYRGGYTDSEYSSENGQGTGGGVGNEDGSGGGGFGGAGGAHAYGAAGGSAYGNLSTALDGGSGGGKSYYSEADHYGGGGGGGLELGARAVCTFQTGCQVQAKGEAGANSATNGWDGNGGGSGGGVLIHAWSVILESGSNIAANGGNGGDGDGPSSEGGSGGGGGGGRVYIAYHTSGSYSNSGTVDVSGGAAGTDGSQDGVAGSSGVFTAVQDANVPYDSSLPVQMAQMKAAQSPEGIVLLWETASEVNCAGFHVWRSPDNVSVYQCITQELIPAQGNSSSGHAYEYVDIHVKPDILYWYQIEEISTDGESALFGPIQVQSVKMVPDHFSLSRAYPNPFNPETHCTIQLPKDSEVSICVYNTRGELIKTLLSGSMKAGTHPVSWRGLSEAGNAMPSGIYFIRMNAEAFSQVQKVMLVR